MKIPFIYFFLFLALLVLSWWSLQTGSMTIGWQKSLQILLSHNVSDVEGLALWELRMPRLLVAFGAGGGLALAGLILQLLTGNALADAYTTGSAGGAALGFNLGAAGFLPVWSQAFYLLPFWSFAGALAVVLIVILLSYHQGFLKRDRMLLAGVSLSMFCGSLVSLLLYLVSFKGDLRHIVFWSLGGFEKASWDYTSMQLGLLLFSLLVLAGMNNSLNLFLIGDQKAKHLGLKVNLVKGFLLVLVSGLAAVNTAIAGVIPFVGIIIPHVVRNLVGVVSVHKIPVSILAGGVYLVLCDLIGRWLAAPAGLPVGIITSFAGIPFFLYLLSRKGFNFQ